jgi:hypothetical protein
VTLNIGGRLQHDRFQILESVGAGAQGTVYRANDSNFGEIALKHYEFDSAMADSERQSLENSIRNEAKLLRKLTHPVLAKVFDIFHENGDIFLTMEYVAGPTLKEDLVRRNHAPLRTTDLMEWAMQLLDALMHVHANNVVHRDIKPENLKAVEDGKGKSQIRLLDFGLAKDMKKGSLNWGWTPPYAPPEQMKFLPTDGRADLYALAATLYHLGTGRKPESAQDRAIAVRDRKPDPLQPPHMLAGSSIPKSVSAVLMKAMELNPEQRIHSAAEMRDALRAAEQVEFVPRASNFGLAVKQRVPLVVILSVVAAGVLAIADPPPKRLATAEGPAVAETSAPGTKTIELFTKDDVYPTPWNGMRIGDKLNVDQMGTGKSGQRVKLESPVCDYVYYYVAGGGPERGRQVSWMRLHFHDDKAADEARARAVTRFGGDKGRAVNWWVFPDKKVWTQIDRTGYEIHSLDLENSSMPAK